MQMKRAAAYGRVSTNSKAQEHSFENQSAYWNRVLGNDPQYKYVGLYADKGISGKHLRLRPQMLALLDACRSGEIDIIFTKSVQRFARNTQELLEVVRELRERDIAVVFEKEGINTLNPDSELYLTVAAAVAEEDLTRYGQNVAWAIEQSFQKGELTVIGVTLLGYRTINKKMVIIPYEAETVRIIYEMYATGEHSCLSIAKYLNEIGRKPLLGDKWRGSQVMTTIKNEKYKGSALLRKSFNEKGRTVTNRGERDMYYVENSHDPIIDEELWAKANAIMDSRAKKGVRGNTIKSHLFSHLIECPKCGKKYLHKINSSGTKYACPFYKCQTQMQGGVTACDNNGIKEIVLHEKFVECYNELVTNKYNGEEDKAVKREIAKVLEEERELNRLKVKGLISKADFVKDMRELEKKRMDLELELNNLKKGGVQKNSTITIEDLNEDIVSRVIKKVIVHDWIVTFVFYNGVEISREYTNGKPGNQVGWADRKRLKEEQNGNNSN